MTMLRYCEGTHKNVHMHSHHILVGVQTGDEYTACRRGQTQICSSAYLLLHLALYVWVFRQVEQ